MAKGGSSLTWSGDMTDKINQFGPKMKRAMVTGAKYIEPQAVEHMKNNAPWTDRTANARNGLSAQTEVGRNSVTIYLFHTVPYGPWLEVRWSGKFQIINPTVELFAPKLVELVAKLAFD